MHGHGLLAPGDRSFGGTEKGSSCTREIREGPGRAMQGLTHVVLLLLWGSVLTLEGAGPALYFKANIIMRLKPSWAV